MKRFFAFAFSSLALLMSVSMMQSCTDSDVDTNVMSQSIDYSWLYIQPSSSNLHDVESALLAGESVAGSQRVNLPHCAVSDTSGSSSGKSFYYRKFFVPAGMEGKRISLYLGGVSENASIWINGDSVGCSTATYRPFILDFAPNAGENSVVVRLDNCGSLYSSAYICGQDSLSFTNEGENLDFDAGISVSTLDINQNSGKIAFCANIRNSYQQGKKVRLDYRILDHNRRELATGHTRTMAAAGSFVDMADTVLINDITLWDIDNPWLYTIEFKLSSDGAIVDFQKVDFGFRTFEVVPGGIVINGHKRYLMGVNVKHQYPYVGPAISPEAHWRDAYRIKRGGFDFVNVSSVDHPNQFLSACDRYGIIVLDTCADAQSRIRRNHPCVLHLPDSRGVRIYGKSPEADLDSPEPVLLEQTNVFASCHNNNCNGKTFADALLSVFDCGASANGVMSQERRPKLSYFFFQTQRDIDESDLQAFAEPFCNILSRWIPGESNGVQVATNCSAVELVVDGVSLGKKTVDRSGSFLSHPSVYFDAKCMKPGSIKAIAYIGDIPKAESVVSTPGNPVRIKLIIDERGTLISHNDVVLVNCYILDNAGNPVVNCNDGVEFAVTGTAQLLSPAKVDAKAGVATCLIRTGKSANDFTISAKCGQMYTVADK
ncbi:MAG: DUF4982 domain-containing protein [Bacteroidales bacterium]|nr:DUF4982 domain-containing protein [Bacteroidales bacterium]